MNPYIDAKDLHQLSWEYYDKSEGWHLSCDICGKRNFRFLTRAERDKFLSNYNNEDFTKLEKHLLQTYLKPHIEEPQHAELIMLRRLAGESS